MVPALAGLFLLSGCDYEIPLTAEPTRPVDIRLLGEWFNQDGFMRVRQLDNHHLVVVFKDSLFRAYHSDCAGTALISLQSLDSKTSKYTYAAYTLSEDNQILRVRIVDDGVLSKTIKDTATMQKTLQDKAGDPNLLTKETLFIRHSE